MVVFEQSDRGRSSGTRSLPVECDAVVCVAGDVYGTGRQDIVVGNFSSPDDRPPGDHLAERGRPEAIMRFKAATFMFKAAT